MVASLFTVSACHTAPCRASWWMQATGRCAKIASCSLQSSAAHESWQAFLREPLSDQSDDVLAVPLLGSSPRGLFLRYCLAGALLAIGALCVGGECCDDA